MRHHPSTTESSTANKWPEPQLRNICGLIGNRKWRHLQIRLAPPLIEPRWNLSICNDKIISIIIKNNWIDTKLADKVSSFHISSSPDNNRRFRFYLLNQLWIFEKKFLKNKKNGINMIIIFLFIYLSFFFCLFVCFVLFCFVLFCCCSIVGAVTNDKWNLSTQTIANIPDGNTKVL